MQVILAEYTHKFTNCLHGPITKQGWGLEDELLSLEVQNSSSSCMSTDSFALSNFTQYICISPWRMQNSEAKNALSRLMFLL